MSRFGIIGATNYIGESAAGRLRASGHEAVGFSRSPPQGSDIRVLATRTAQEGEIPYWIDVAPIWTFADRREQIASHGAKRIVAISSTSRFTKSGSASAKESELALKLERGEDELANWCEASGIQWTVLRPTLIYGLGKDRNVREIAAIIRRFGFFPMFGAASGGRQPIHAEDLARACISALLQNSKPNQAFNVSGGEVLTYRQMVARIFEAMGRRPMMPTVPLSLFKLALAGVRKLPRFSHWTPQMAERMNLDMVFDHSEATAAFGFSPRPFQLTRKDLA